MGIEMPTHYRLLFVRPPFRSVFSLPFPGSFPFPVPFPLCLPLHPLSQIPRFEPDAEVFSLPLCLSCIPLFAGTFGPWGKEALEIRLVSFGQGGLGQGGLGQGGS